MSHIATPSKLRGAALTTPLLDPDDPAEADDSIREYVRSRVWVTDSQRKRCTYVTRDEQPADALIRRF
ncbi:MAG TPA: hypothetical protein VFI47_08300 [Acidimicrobiales bacterium]|nr:hypothetical protein [Acidimicrobiales bacterium]